LRPGDLPLQADRRDAQDLEDHYWLRYESPFALERVMARKGGSFKNVKLGKNIHRQIKRRGAPQRELPARPAPMTGRKPQ
jgi:hypothetical protein